MACSLGLKTQYSSLNFRVVHALLGVTETRHFDLTHLFARTIATINWSDRESSREINGIQWRISHVELQ